MKTHVRYDLTEMNVKHSGGAEKLVLFNVFLFSVGIPEICVNKLQLSDACNKQNKEPKYANTY